MANATNITFKPRSNDTVTQNSDGTFSWQPNFSWSQSQGNTPQANGSSQPPQQGSTDSQGSDDRQRFNGNYKQNARNQIMQSASQGVPNLNPYLADALQYGKPLDYSRGFQNVPGIPLKVYNQDAIDAYNKGLQEAQDKDAKYNTGLNTYTNVYKILHPEPDVQYTPFGNDNAAIQYQTKDLGDGSQLQNPNTNPELALQWNEAKLRQLHPDWTDDMINNYMNQNFNWQSAQALTNEGVWEPTQASKDWTNYLAYQAELQRQAEAEAAAQADSGSGDSGGDYSDSYDGGSDYSDDGDYSGGGDDSGSDDNYQFVVASDPRYDLTGNNLYDWTPARPSWYIN